MPTYREDMHTGHKVPMIETDDITNRSVTEEKMADGSVSTRMLQDRSVTEPKMADGSVSTRTMQDRSVTEPKMADNSVSNRTVQDDAIDSRNIRPKAIKSSHIDDGQILAMHIGNDVIPTHVRPITDKLQQQIDSFNDHGMSVSNEFGSNSHIGVSQKTLTEAFNKLWQKLEDMTGEVLQGISMSVTPDYFISEDGCSVHISANTVETNGIFEHIAFYGNGSLIAEADNVDFFEYDTEIEETTIIKCVAKIMGIEYTRQQIVTHYNSFWLGAGSTYSDIMDVEHVIPITNGMRGAYDVDVAQGQHIIIIVGESLAGGFLRADLNSVEINFTETSVTVDGKGYRVYMSEPWSAGSYNIDVNG